MRRFLSFSFFFVVITALSVGLHYYFWTRLVRAPQWPAPWRSIGTAIMVVLGVVIPLTMASQWLLPRWMVKPMATVAFVWMGATLFLFMAVLASDLLRWIVPFLANRFGGDDLVFDEDRRKLLTRGTAAAVGVITAGSTAISVKGALADVTLEEVEIPLARLPPALDGLTIVQLSDVHIGPTIGRGFIEELVHKANALKPDAIVITGDLVDGSVAALRHHAEPLGKLASRWGSFFITGNHEYYSGADEWAAECARLGMRVLRNERVVLGDAAASIDLAGIDDANAGRFGIGHGPNIDAVIAGRDPERELVLLAHQPKAIVDAERAGAGLQISGHTHGGQIWPVTMIAGLIHPYLAGHYRHDDATQIYVSRGTGYWGPPMRLAAPAEITKLVLTTG